LNTLPAFYPILDTLLLARAGIEPISAAEALLDAGVEILQIRHKGHWLRQVFEQAETIAHLCSQAGALFVVNDRADIAALLRAGLHLGQDDLPPARARQIVRQDTLIGYSTHNERQLVAAAWQPVNYLALGPIFNTGSKENPDPVVGLADLRRLRGLTARPLVAIGGVTRLNAAGILEAGADSLAVISDLLPDVRGRAKEWMEIVRNKS
jgi:thiamine-phosphate pyrophosphorylase